MTKTPSNEPDFVRQFIKNIRIQGTGTVEWVERELGSSTTPHGLMRVTKYAQTTRVYLDGALMLEVEDYRKP